MIVWSSDSSGTKRRSNALSHRLARSSWRTYLTKFSARIVHWDPCDGIGNYKASSLCHHGGIAGASCRVSRVHLARRVYRQLLHDRVLAERNIGERGGARAADAAAGGERESCARLVDNDETWKVMGGVHAMRLECGVCGDAFGEADVSPIDHTSISVDLG